MTEKCLLWLIPGVIVTAVTITTVLSVEKNDIELSRVSTLSTLATGTSTRGTSTSSTPCDLLRNSRKFAENCHGNETHLPLLITGVGGSGTHTISSMLSQKGLDLPHELIGFHGSVSWFYAVDAEYQCSNASELVKCAGYYPYAIPPHRILVRFDKVFYQTRCPMSNIASMATHPKVVFEFTAPLTGVNLMNEKDPIIRAARTFVAWSKHLVRIADYRYKLETVNITDVIERAGLSSECRQTDLDDEQRSEETVLNSHQHADLTLTSLRERDAELAKEVEAIAVEQGYGSCAEDCKCSFDSR